MGKEEACQRCRTGRWASSLSYCGLVIVHKLRHIYFSITNLFRSGSNEANHLNFHDIEERHERSS